MLSFEDMLTKRTNILFDQQTWDFLVGLAEEKKTSVGELVRTAVNDTYKSENESQLKRRTSAVERIIELRKQMKHTFTTQEILELVREGRKYE